MACRESVSTAMDFRRFWVGSHIRPNSEQVASRQARLALKLSFMKLILGSEGEDAYHSCKRHEGVSSGPSLYVKVGVEGDSKCQRDSQ
jgi:hypothetical protein